MVRSMTGYGRGEKAFEGRTVTIELRAVNNRYLDTLIKIPRTYIFMEDVIKTRIQGSVARGKVDVFVTVSNTGDEAVSITVNKSLAKAYIDALEQLHQMDAMGWIKLDCHVTDLARFPDVLMIEKAPEDTDEISSQILEVLELALDDFNSMREREGRCLAQDILDRAKLIKKLVAFVEERSPRSVSEYRARLEVKMAEVLQNIQIDESRILTEAAIFADKVAVDEETVRLHSHLDQLQILLTKGGSIGRKLDFLIQEFNREANTIGAKCNDMEISRHVVDLKAEIEKIREQVQNIE